MLSEDEQYKINAFDWEQAFPQVFEAGGFDVVIGNPPYIFARDKGFTEPEKTYFSNHFAHQNYQLNTYSIFTEKGLITRSKPLHCKLVKKADSQEREYEFVRVPGAVCN
jgi:methylase of polypeptide subunit release factors